MTGKLTQFFYKCNDGYCESDLTEDGKHIKYLVTLENGLRRNFDFLADAQKWAKHHGAELG